MNLDITIVAGSRPDLLAITLASFNENLFRNFAVRNVIANIDPIFGAETERQQCINIIGKFFANAKIVAPTAPSFGMAVKRTWESTQGDLIFHLEDDWVLLEPISPPMIAPLVSANFAGIKPVAAEHRWLGSDPARNHRPLIEIGGLKFGTRSNPVQFGTSPGFFAGDFVRTVAQLLITNLDPEKQVKMKYNPELASFCRKFKFTYLPGQSKRELIQDIGRAWRQARGIDKITTSGRSIWRGVE